MLSLITKNKLLGKTNSEIWGSNTIAGSGYGTVDKGDRVEPLISCTHLKTPDLTFSSHL